MKGDGKGMELGTSQYPIGRVERDEIGYGAARTFTPMYVYMQGWCEYGDGEELHMRHQQANDTGLAIKSRRSPKGQGLIEAVSAPYMHNRKISFRCLEEEKLAGG